MNTVLFVIYIKNIFQLLDFYFSKKVFKIDYTVDTNYLMKLQSFWL